MPPADDPAKLQLYLIRVDPVYYSFLHTESRVHHDINRLNIIIEQYHNSHFHSNK